MQEVVTRSTLTRSLVDMISEESRMDHHARAFIHIWTEDTRPYIHHKSSPRPLEYTTFYFHLVPSK